MCISVAWISIIICSLVIIPQTKALCSEQTKYIPCIQSEEDGKECVFVDDECYSWEKACTDRLNPLFTCKCWSSDEFKCRFYVKLSTPFSFSFTRSHMGSSVCTPLVANHGTPSQVMFAQLSTDQFNTFEKHTHSTKGSETNCTWESKNEECLTTYQSKACGRCNCDKDYSKSSCFWREDMEGHRCLWSENDGYCSDWSSACSDHSIPNYPCKCYFYEKDKCDQYVKANTHLLFSSRAFLRWCAALSFICALKGACTECAHIFAHWRGTCSARRALAQRKIKKT